MMKQYFTRMYFARNKNMKFFISFLKDNEINWEDSNLNLYNICENLNLLCSEKSAVVQNNLLLFEESIVCFNYQNLKKTVIILYNIFDFTLIKISEIFIVFSIFKYINSIIITNRENCIMNNNDFINWASYCVEKYKHKINNNSVIIPDYFKILITNELDKFITNII